jgi:hypothetical protein
MPSISTSTSAAPVFSLGFRITYLAPILNVWSFVSDSVGGHKPALVPMTGDGNNPNSDATFTRLIRTDRTSGFSTALTPHSTSGPNFGQTEGSPAWHAIRGIFTPSGAGSGLSFTNAINIPAPDAGDTRNFVGFLNSPTGFTIILGDGEFWFRSKADPNDWFVATIISN